VGGHADPPALAGATDAPSEAMRAPTPRQESAQMLEPHAPHEPIHTWRGFFIHIATIVVGLLIAIGLEQTVEYFHHRHQVAEIRQSLAEERRINEAIFDGGTAEFRRYSPVLRGMLETTQYLRQHPGAPESQWPSRYRFYILTTSYQDSSWRTAQESGVLQYMPRSEVRAYGDLYARLSLLSETSAKERDAVMRAKAYILRAPDPAHLTAEQLEREFDLINEVRVELYLLGNQERNLSGLYRDFRDPPSDAEYYALIPPPPDPGDYEDVRRMHQHVDAITKQQDDAVGVSQP